MNKIVHKRLIFLQMCNLFDWFRQCFFRKKPDVKKEPYFRIND